MMPLLLLLVLALCSPAPSQSLLGSRYHCSPDPGLCGDEQPLETLFSPSRLICAMRCQQLACTSADFDGTFCRMFRWRPRSIIGTLLTRQKPAPDGYSLCQDSAYRVFDYTSRSSILQACNNSMAMPLRETQRAFLAGLVATFGASAPSQLDYRTVTYVDGVIEYSSSDGYRFRSEKDQTLISIPSEAWLQFPHSEAYNQWIALGSTNKFQEWNHWSRLMSSCQVEIELDHIG